MANHPNRSHTDRTPGLYYEHRVITWQVPPDGAYVHITPEQETRLRGARTWPKAEGVEYCRVSRGLHWGDPTYTDAEIDAMCAAAQD